MRISEMVIGKVIAGEGTAEENRQVAELFRENPELLDRYLTDQSWDGFTVSNEDGALSVPREDMRKKIEAQVGMAPVRRLHWGWVAAASLLAVIVVVSLVYRQRATNREGAMSGEIVQAGKGAPDAAKGRQLSRRDTVRNSTTKLMLLSLPDGSDVELGPGSALSFANPFGKDHRDIQLSGEAKFSVKKNISKTFTVYTRGMATTALGTVFSVDDKHGAVATVHLFSGRVMIKPGESSSPGHFKTIYLEPGEVLTLQKADLTVTVRKAATKESAMPAPRLLQPLKFEQQPLEEIFARLQKAYNVNIKYEPDKLKNMDFTGSFDGKKETVESFLSTLCDLNDLILKKTGGGSFSIQTK